MVANPRLTADCAKCGGLCCVAPAFDAEQGFGYNKPAHTPCAHLLADDRCAIHHALHARGFASCAHFECHGAGQRVTALFSGQSWRSSPELARQMFTAYFRCRSLHELMFFLELAIPKASPPDAKRLREWIETIDRLCETIDRLCETGAAGSGSVRIDELRRQVFSDVRLALAANS